MLKTIRVKGDGSFEEQHHAPAAGFVVAPQAEPGAYAVRVRGDALAPAIKDGYFLLIEPTGACVVGEEVLVALVDGRAFCMQLLFERIDTCTFAALNGGEQMTIERKDIESMHAVSAICPPSKWRSL